MNWQPLTIFTYTGLGEYLQIASNNEEFRVRWLKHGNWFLYWNSALPNYKSLVLKGSITSLLPVDINIEEYILSLLSPNKHYLKHYNTWTIQDNTSTPEIIEMELDLLL